MMFVLLIGGASAQALVLGDLTLTEFMADTQQVSQYYAEWFEIYNNSRRTLDVNGIIFRHTDDGGVSFEERVVNVSLNIGAYDYAVFGVSDELNQTALDYNGNVPVDFVYDFYAADGTVFDLNLSSDKFQVIYLDLASGGTEVLLDEVSWTGAWPTREDYAHQVSDYIITLEWANDWPSNWCPSDVFITGSGLYGSPGADNSTCGGAGTDDDGDGYTEQQGDCLDTDATVNPDATDGADGSAGNQPSWDDDCDGRRDDGLTDDDGDGYAEIDGDCDDEDPNTFPRALEVSDGEDDDCNGCPDDLDNDGDGFTDCPEYRDLDGDGLADDPYYDCNNADNTINPLATEVPRDGIDNNCDGFDECDVDEDGYDSNDPECGGPDCNDDDASIHPDAVEDNTDGKDNDCDGVIDIPDRDGDGYSALDGDCMDLGDDDTDDPNIVALAQTVNPGAIETCGDLIDNDCDGFYDNDPACTPETAFATIRGGGLCAAADGSAAGLFGIALGLLALSRRRVEHI